MPGVESVTVNFAVGNATVRYDETRLQAADIKAAVHQSANESVDEPQPEPESEHKHADKRAAVPQRRPPLQRPQSPFPTPAPGK